MLIRVNTIESKWDNRVVQLETTWEVFCSLILLGHSPEQTKDSVKLFNGAIYKPVGLFDPASTGVVFDPDTQESYTRRLADNVESVGLLILDYDGTVSLEDAKDRFREYEYVAYTSFRHRMGNATDRFRIVFPLATPIPASARFTDCDDLIDGAAWYELETALKNFAGDCDPVSFRCNQFYYLPAAPRDQISQAQVWHNNGKLLDWTSWGRTPTPKRTPNEIPASSRRRSTSQHLEPNQLLRTQLGDVRVRDVLTRVEGVWCPFHDDHNGSEFVKRIPESGDVFLFCRKCDKTFWMRRDFSYLDAEVSGDPLIVVDQPSRLALFADASDRQRVNDQLRKIGTAITRARVPPSPNRPVSYPTHLVYLPEGTGKSGLAFDLAVQGQKILFACKSLAQVFEKYEWFCKRAEQLAVERAEQRQIPGALGEEYAPPMEAPINVQLFLSKGAKAVRRFGVDVVRLPKEHPFDPGKIDDEASILAFREANPKLSEELIRLIWHFCKPDRLRFGTELIPVATDDGEMDDLEAGSQKFNTADIIVTTFAQARLLRVRNQFLPFEWTIWFDDPDVSDFADIEPYDPEVWGDFDEDELAEKGIVTRIATGQKYFKRDPGQSLGSAVSRHRCVYTTTEQVTLRAAKKITDRRNEYTLVHDGMEGVSGGKITLLGTNKVYASYDGIIPLMVRRLVKEGHSVRLIADGLGQSLNHSNSKGKNDLAASNLVIEISQPHPDKVKTICDAIGEDFYTERHNMTRELVLDQLHQALGRNSGYRYQGKECVCLVPAKLHQAVLDKVRYAYDERNSVQIDRLSTMGRGDKRTQGEASSLVLAIEHFLNNFDLYVQDKRKVIPDVDYVLGGITDEADRSLYAARLLHALTTFTEIRFDKPPEVAAEQQDYREAGYRAVADNVARHVPEGRARENLWILYRKRIGVGSSPKKSQVSRVKPGDEGKIT